RADRGRCAGRALRLLLARQHPRAGERARAYHPLRRAARDPRRGPARFAAQPAARSGRNRSPGAGHALHAGAAQGDRQGAGPGDRARPDRAGPGSDERKRDADRKAAQDLPQEPADEDEGVRAPGRRLILIALLIAAQITTIVDPEKSSSALSVEAT